MADKNNFGYKDQEILIGAIAKHVAKTLKLSEGIVRGKIRITIDDIFNKNGLSLHDIKALKEKDRDEYTLDFLSIFFTKLNIDIKKRRNLKYDCLQIYERWKEYKRLEVGQAEEYIPEHFKSDKDRGSRKQQIEINDMEESLIHDFNKLDLEGLI